MEGAALLAKGGGESLGLNYPAIHGAKSMLNLSSQTRGLLLASSLIGLLASNASQAAKPDECGAWVLLPDFRCDNREARPEGSFNPVGMPYLFEDPYITTGLNFAYIYHRLPDEAALGIAFDGGGVHVLALQIRVAITEWLAFIATKDGLTILRPGDDSVVDRDTGIMDMTIGFKAKLFETDDFILSPAIRYEIPMGSEKLFQGYGDGVFIPSASFRWGFLENANLIGSLGGQVPVDSKRNVRSLFYNIHLDYGIPMSDSFVKYIVPFVELNGLHYTKSGDGTNTIHTSLGNVTLNAAQSVLMSGPFEGVDVANLGSTGMAGKDVLVMGGGVRLPTTSGISFALMYEGAVTERKDIHHQRFTFMATWEM